MAKEIVKVVDPGCGSDADYTSLAAWVAGEQRDLPAAFEIAVAECRVTGNVPDTIYVNLSGFVTDADHPITIRTDPEGSHRHQGTRGNGYRLVLDDASGGLGRTFDCCQDYVRIEGIGFDLSCAGEATVLEPITFVTGSANGGESDSSGCHWLDAVALFSERGGLSVEYGETSDFSAVNLITVCDTSHAALRLVGLFNKAKIYNAVLVGGGLSKAMLTGSDYFKNCYVCGGYNPSCELECCASNISSGSPDLQNVPYDNSTFVCTTLGSEDLHLTTGSPLVGKGVNLSEDTALGYFKDIDGNVRHSALPWSVGVHEPFRKIASGKESPRKKTKRHHEHRHNHEDYWCRRWLNY